VLCSHLHVDHVGWNTRLDNGRWAPTFPNAPLSDLAGANGRIGRRRDRPRWCAPATTSPTACFRCSRPARLTSSATSTLWTAGVSVEPAPGHTPGQLMVRVGSGREQAILSADLMHHPLQVRYPDWSTRFCTDPGEARTTRWLLQRPCGHGRLIFPAHFPSPTGGTIERDGKDFRFTFCGEDLACFGGA